MSVPFSKYLTARAIFLCVQPIARLSLAVVVGTTASLNLNGQESNSQYENPPASAVTGNIGADPRALAGGGSMADFSTLMMLIEQTIEPDSWLSAGGESSMLPYYNGVYIDPRGHLRRMRDIGAMPEGPAASAQSDPSRKWKVGGGLRTFSLKQLDAALAEVLKMGLGPTRDMRHLAGLGRIQYVAIDQANRDVLLAGPVAGDQENAGFLLDDLVILTRLISNRTPVIGCSIDPSQDGLKKASDLLNQPNTVTRLGRNPKSVAQQLQSAIGAHSISIFGLDRNTSTALAIVEADEHMKRVGLGVAKTVPRVKSYFDHLESTKDVPAQSLVRWWFSYSDQPINVSPQKDVFELPKNLVAVLSEQQWMDQQGNRRVSGGNDPAADAFALEMTEKLPEIRNTHPSYARLCSIYEMSMALQLAIESADQSDLHDWLPTICSHSSLNPAPAAAPKSVDGLATWNRMRSGTVVAVISGGIVIDSARRASSARRIPTNSLKSDSMHSVSEVSSIGLTNWHD